MKKIDNSTLFHFFGMALVAFGWLAFFLAVFGFFRSWIIITVASILALTFLYLLAITLKKSRFSWDFLLTIILSLAAILIFSHYTSPTIFTGRDQGSLSASAISLSQNHSLSSNFLAEKQFFNIYGPGIALNFPGFYYTKNGDLITQFPIGYISWLGAFYTLFGMGGLIIANAFSFFLFLLSFYTIARNYLSEKMALSAIFLVLTSFIFSWFFKFTLSENLALALLWFGMAEFILFWEKEKRKNLLAFILSFGLLLFIRIEAVAFIAIISIILFSKYYKKKLLAKKIFFHWKIIASIIFILIALLASLRVNAPFYLTFVKGFLNSFKLYDTDTAKTAHSLSDTFYIFRVFSAYALLPYIVLGLISFFYFLKKNNFKTLIPYFIVLPIFIYLLNPSISADHPWMLRRYVFAIIPICILYSIIFLAHFLKTNRFFYVFALFLLLTNLLIFSPYLSVKENPTLLSQISNLNQNFSDDDLILVDRNATGSPWAMMDGPLRLIFQKQAVYFFNPEDIKKIDLKKFANVYFIVPDKNIDFYRNSGLLDRFITIKSYSLENLTLNESGQSKQELRGNPIILPPYLKNYIYGKIYLLRQS